MSFFDRACVNDALDALLDRENGKDEKVDEEARDEKVDEEARDEKIEAEARRAARLSFDGWREGAAGGDEQEE